MTFNVNMFCAGKDSCGGDSGGPLMIHKLNRNKKNRKYWVQIGLVSWGRAKCGSKGAPGVYTTIGYHMKWILDNLEP